MSEALRVALTFDAEHPDRPGAAADGIERILSTLGDASARATFFVQGRWAEAQPEAARRIATDGHLIGNHSHYHARMPLLSDDGIRADVGAADEAVTTAAGVPTRPFFRCPFGEGADDPRVLAALRGLGYRHVGYHVVLEDWEPWRTAEAIAADAIDGVDRVGDGAVVLLHTWPGHTADALPALLDGLRARSVELVGIDELPEESLP